MFSFTSDNNSPEKGEGNGSWVEGGNRFDEGATRRKRPLIPSNMPFLRFFRSLLSGLDLPLRSYRL
ncbi:hypothetical protein AAG906_006643 [Vitis piasezkii]